MEIQSLANPSADSTPTSTAGFSAHKLRVALANTPLITIPGDALVAVSGVNDAVERLKREPLNPYGHYRLGLQLAGLRRNQNIYRVVRGLIHPLAVIAFTAAGTALKAFDEENVDPEELAYNSAIATASAILKSNDDARLYLLIGASAYRIAKKTRSKVWQTRATKAFLKTIEKTDNAIIAADAAIGLMLLIEDKSHPERLELAQRARSLGSRSTLLGFAPYSGPSIWDIRADDRPLDNKLFDTVNHVLSGQAKRIKNISAKLGPLLKET